MLEHLVCSVWCEACDDECNSKLEGVDFKDIYNEYKWLKKDVDEIYEICKTLAPEERLSIKNAFDINNQIERLCNGAVAPKHLIDLPNVVESKMKPLLVKFYEDLLKRSKVPGDKLEYYQKLSSNNDDIHYCPCCGLMPFEPADSIRLEAFDHYLPKAQYPFLSVNFENLVPLCYKCNSDRKGTKDPIEGTRKVFYPFSTTNDHHIEISIKIDTTKDIRNLTSKDLKIQLGGDAGKIDTWDWLFDIKDRYNAVTRGFSKSVLKQIKRRHNECLKTNAEQTYLDTLNTLIKEYEFDKFEETKFLRIPYMEELKNCSHLIDVYSIE